MTTTWLWLILLASPAEMDDTRGLDRTVDPASPDFDVPDSDIQDRDIQGRDVQDREVPDRDFQDREDPYRSRVDVDPSATQARTGASADNATRLSLIECTRRALESNHRIQQTDARTEEVEAIRKATRGQLGPRLGVDADVQVWDRELALEFPAPDIPGLPESDVEPLVVRDRVTANFRTTVAQPLSGLWGLTEAHRAQKKDVAAANLSGARERSSVALDVARAYYDALKVERLAEVAAISVAAIEANRARAEALHAAGTLGLDQLLEADARLAEARSLEIRTRGQLRLARAQLAFLMGMEVDADIAPRPVSRESLPRVDRDLESVVARALGRRPEVAEAGLRIDQARHARRAATSSMLPQLSAVASYQRTEGQAFALTNQFFVGLNLSWNVFEWGAKYYGIPKARAQERQAQIAQAQISDAIRLEIHRALIELEVSEQQMETAEAAATHAEENLRIVELRFDAAAASATEVLDAVARRTRAEAERANAYYGYLQAIAAYEHGLGEILDPLREAPSS